MKMLPIGPLMIEHRLIERMIQIMKIRLEEIKAGKEMNPAEIEKIIRFIRGYADRCHHGKEEDILFRALNAKTISPEHRRTMEELMEDHRRGRELTLSIWEANERYQKGDEAALSAIADAIRFLVEFYPKHIEKEDKHFFIPVMDYFSPEEKEAMIRKGYESDSRLLHEEYAHLVKDFEVQK